MLSVGLKSGKPWWSFNGEGYSSIKRLTLRSEGVENERD